LGNSNELNARFHETKENKMFKKSLLALSVAAFAGAASAGTLSVKVEESNTAAYATAVTGTFTAGATNECSALVATYGVKTANITYAAGFTKTTVAVNDGDSDDTVSVTAFTDVPNGIYDAGVAVNTLNYTGDKACTLTVRADESLIGANVAKYSLEGATANGVTIEAAQVAGIGGIAEENTIIFTITGGTINGIDSQNATLVTGTRNSTTGVITVVDAQNTFTLNGVVGNTILFSADTGYGNAGGVGSPFEILWLSGVEVTPDAGVTELLISSVVQNTAAIVVDTTKSTVVTNIDNQYTSTVVAGLDGIIDVASERYDLIKHTDTDSSKVLLGGTNDANNVDSLVVKNKLNTSQGNLSADTITYTISGDFAWMADLDAAGDEDGKIESAEIMTAVTLAGFDALTAGALTTAVDDAITKAAVNSDLNELTLTIDGTDGVADLYHHIKIVTPGTANDAAEVLVAQDFVADIVIAESKEAVTMKSATALDAGEWTLNGSVVTIPYMPFGPNTKVIMRHTNTGVQDGAITVRYMIEDGGTDWVSVGEVVASSTRGVMDIRDAVMEAIMADAGVTKGKVAIEITTNVPSKDVTVYAAYNVKNSADDRGFVGTFGEHGSAK